MPVLFLVLGLLVLGVAVPVALAARDNHDVIDNNPGNLEDRQPDPILWTGRTGYTTRIIDGVEWRATTFDTLEHGLRALMRNAIRQYEKLKADPGRPETLYEFGEIWAPTGHGGNKDYGLHLAGVLGVDQNAPYDFIRNLDRLAMAIITNERGQAAARSVPLGSLEIGRVTALAGTQFQGMA